MNCKHPSSHVGSSRVGVIRLRLSEILKEEGSLQIQTKTTHSSMYNQCPRRVLEPLPKRLPRVAPNSPNELAGRWNPSPEEFTRTSQDKTSPSETQEPSSVHLEDLERLHCVQRSNNAIPYLRSCATSQSSLLSIQPLEEVPYQFSLNEWRAKVAQAELRVALRYSMDLLLNLALYRRSAFSEARGESLSR